MRIERADLQAAADEGLIEPARVEPLHGFLRNRQPERARFTPAHVLYYLGGLLAIAAMALFMRVGWELLGGWGLFGLALCYGAGGVMLLRYWLYRCRLRVPAGLAGAFVVALVPLAVFGLQAALGYWPGGLEYDDPDRLFHWRRLYMGLASLVVGLVLFYRYRLPFLLAPVAVTLWLLSMNLAVLLLPAIPDAPWRGELWWLRQFVSLWCGLAMLLTAFWVDLRTRTREDPAFWLYLIGALVFWGGFTLLQTDNAWSLLVYAGVNILLIAVGAVLARRVFAVFGGLGLAYYIGHLAFEVFDDSLWFAIALTVIGLALVLLGIAWQRHEAAIGAVLRRPLPAAVRALIERRAV